MTTFEDLEDRVRSAVSKVVDASEVERIVKKVLNAAAFYERNKNLVKGTGLSRLWEASAKANLRNAIGRIAEGDYDREYLEYLLKTIDDMRYILEKIYGYS